MDSAGLGLPVAAIVTSFTIGILVTIISAVLPAIKAARVAPIAAMRDVGRHRQAADRHHHRRRGRHRARRSARWSWGLAGAGGATLPLVFGGVLADAHRGGAARPR